jgi:hypothetical protein
MARPTKLTKEVSERICLAIRASNYAVVAARSAGVSESSYYRWLDRGRSAGRGIYREFYEDIERAEAEGEARAVALIASAMPRDWRAAMAILERRYSARWSRKLAVAELLVKPEPRKPDLSKLSLDEAKTLREILKRAQPD